MLVLHMLGKQERPQRRYWVYDQRDLGEEADQEEDISPLGRDVRCGGRLGVRKVRTKFIVLGDIVDQMNSPRPVTMW